MTKPDEPKTCEDIALEEYAENASLLECLKDPDRGADIKALASAFWGGNDQSRFNEVLDALLVCPTEPSNGEKKVCILEEWVDEFGCHQCRVIEVDTKFDDPDKCPNKSWGIDYVGLVKLASRKWSLAGLQPNTTPLADVAVDPDDIDPDCPTFLYYDPDLTKPFCGNPCNHPDWDSYTAEEQFDILQRVSAGRCDEDGNAIPPEDVGDVLPPIAGCWTAKPLGYEDLCFVLVDCEGNPLEVDESGNPIISRPQTPAGVFYPRSEENCDIIGVRFEDGTPVPFDPVSGEWIIPEAPTLTYCNGEEIPEGGQVSGPPSLGQAGPLPPAWPENGIHCAPDGTIWAQPPGRCDATGVTEVPGGPLNDIVFGDTVSGWGPAYRTLCVSIQNADLCAPACFDIEAGIGAGKIGGAVPGAFEVWMRLIQTSYAGNATAVYGALSDAPTPGAIGPGFIAGEETIVPGPSGVEVNSITLAGGGILPPGGFVDVCYEMQFLDTIGNAGGADYYFGTLWSSGEVSS